MSKIPPDAFEVYVGLGPERSYEAVARHYRVTKGAITKRATREHWQERLARIEEKARSRADDKLAESIEAMNDRHLKLLQVVQGKALQALQSMPLTSAMDAVRALDLSVRQERTIRGEPGERSAVSIEDTIRREYDRWMTTSSSTQEPAAEETDETDDGDETEGADDEPDDATE